MRKPFSLLARSDPDLTTPTRHNRVENAEESFDNDDEEVEADQTINLEVPRQQAAKLREEKLQSDVFILKKLNASFELFNDALQATGSANERVAAQLEQTDALLNKYINILSKSDEYSRLIFDERWQGAEADEDALEEEARQVAEKTRREAEERAIRAQQEALRLEQENTEQSKREERERIEREKSERARGGVRGVRGNRASMRGMRGVASSRPVEASTTRGIPRRPPSTSARSVGTGPPRGYPRGQRGTTDSTS
ncbi:hypothetical protein B0H34DRAFT_367043 [Crassisporium funariophilum]|nr:hypothetical protein B0H34DRAFT_367043 [Crassisporium funariophilum]